MKGKLGKRKPHVEPLTDRLLDILRFQYERRFAADSDGFIFKGWRPAVKLKDTALSNILHRMSMTDENGAIVTVHGFRTTLRTWLADKGCHREWAERQIAHKFTEGGGSIATAAVQDAYQRSTLIDVRRPWMERWATFCAGADVVQLISAA
jgi:integrase